MTPSQIKLLADLRSGAVLARVKPPGARRRFPTDALIFRLHFLLKIVQTQFT